MKETTLWHRSCQTTSFTFSPGGCQTSPFSRRLATLSFAKSRAREVPRLLPVIRLPKGRATGCHTLGPGVQLARLSAAVRRKFPLSRKQEHVWPDTPRVIRRAVG